MKNVIIALLKWGISLAIVGYLLVDASQSDNFQELVRGPKDWSRLTLALFCVLAALVFTILRWYILVRAIALPFSLKDAFRLGFLGYLLNFVSLGSVGGDLFKAIFVAREQPGRRAEAIATVVIDRVIGLYSLFVVATVAILATSLYRDTSNIVIKAACQGTFLATAIGAVAIFTLLVPRFTFSALSSVVERLPAVGEIGKRLLRTLQTYRRKPVHLAGTFVLSFGVHTLLAIGIFLTAAGLLQHAPSIATHMVVVPLAMVSGVLPLPLNGLGGFEYLLDFLYQQVSDEGRMTTARSLLVALGYRIETILIALVGAGVYLTGRREIRRALAHAEESSLSQSTAIPSAGHQ